MRAPTKEPARAATRAGSEDHISNSSTTGSVRVNGGGPPAQALSLHRYDDMCRAVAECHRVDEVKDIRDRTEALRAYAKQAKNRELEVQFAEVKVRAEIKCGELLKDMAANGLRDQGNGGDRKSQSHDATVNNLENLGLSKDESSRYQQAAKAPAAQVEQAFATARMTMVPVTSAQIRALSKPPTTAPRETATLPDEADILGHVVTTNSKDKLFFCSFCGKSQYEISKLIAGPNVFVCNECVDLCNDIIREHQEEQPRAVRKIMEIGAIVRGLLSPDLIAAELPPDELAVSWASVSIVVGWTEKLAIALQKRMAETEAETNPPSIVEADAKP
jgi:hypothetical protein